MTNDDFTAWALHRFPGRVKRDEPMARHTSFGVGGPADLFVSVKDEKQLRELVLACVEAGVPYTAVAGGTNLLVLDRGIRGVVIDMKKGLKDIRVDGDAGDVVTVRAGAGVNLQSLCQYAIDNGLAGMNFALGIPGTVGGAVIMNAGTARGAMGDVLETVTILTSDGRLMKAARDDMVFRYRHFEVRGFSPDAADPFLVTAARLSCRREEPVRLRAEARDILNERMRSHPVGVRSAGCFFKNPAEGESAGRLIDRAGLKGRRVGGAAVSDKHANYIVNTGGATAADILTLMAEVRREVAERFGVRLEPEVKIVGE
ncbi:MAG: UDP-N-acetylmuramate dehydrogenase [Thermodesulfobacteriota bacterium]